jgi:hypothetical protein
MIIGGGYQVSYAVPLVDAGFRAEEMILVDRPAGLAGPGTGIRYWGLMCDVEAYIDLPFFEETGYTPKHKYFDMKPGEGRTIQLYLVLKVRTTAKEGGKKKRARRLSSWQSCQTGSGQVTPILTRPRHEVCEDWASGTSTVRQKNLIGPRFYIILRPFLFEIHIFT